MRILYVVNSAIWGGGEQVALTSGLEMSRRGHSVAVAVPPGTPLHARCVRERDRIDVLPLALGSKLGRRTVGEFAATAWRDRRALLDLAGPRDRRRWDVVHLQYKKEQLLATGPLSKRGVRVAWTEHGNLPPSLARNSLGRNWYRLASRRAAGIAAVSKSVRLSLVRAGVDGHRICVLYTGVDQARFGASQSVRAMWRAEARSELGLEGRELVVGSTCRLEPTQGVGLLLAACVDLLSRVPELRVLVVGDGSAMARLRLNVPASFQSRVVFTGFRTDVPRLLAAMDVFVSPSTDPVEGFPLRNIEAMMAGLPIVASAVGGQPEAVTNGESGLLVPVNDVVSLQSAIERLLRDGDLRTRMGMCALRESERFALSRFAEGHELFLQECLSSRLPT